ncbi:hypothetical protein C8Q79DRAFT_912882 [Trametes meyenii]|nr:hypothetical protein C8Q79DRAFT_912882 [Trametes meyenii]
MACRSFPAEITLSCRWARPASHSSRFLRPCRTQLWATAIQVGRRTASTSANPYPFPRNAHPTPHQIFHLPKSATRADVKARYYDLVRIYHPDSPSARAGGISPETAHTRFQAISSAYAMLSGKKAMSSTDVSDTEGFGPTSRPSYHDLSTAMWRAKQRRRAELDVGLDDRWKERMMLGAVLLVRVQIDVSLVAIAAPNQSFLLSLDAMALFVFQTYTTRAQAISEARNVRRDAPRPRSLDAEAERRLALEAISHSSDSDTTPPVDARNRS